MKSANGSNGAGRRSPSPAQGVIVIAIGVYVVPGRQKGGHAVRASRRRKTQSTTRYAQRALQIMKAAYVNHVGPPENIVYGDFPKPQPKGAEVLVKVVAVDVNPIDTYIRSGAVAMPIPMPFIVGCDLAGTVEAIGPECRRFKPGDRVWGSNQGMLGRQGTFAEYAAVDEAWLYPRPADVSEEHAAAVALVGITAHLGLVRDARLQRGETLFVNGGTGGVGSMVVQMAQGPWGTSHHHRGQRRKAGAVPRVRRRSGDQLQDRRRAARA